MNIDEMQAGREMDCLIAEDVFGWKDASWVCEMHKHNGSPPGGANGLLYIVPHYSSDIAAAWEVIEKLSPLYDYCVNYIPKKRCHHANFIIPKEGHTRLEISVIGEDDIFDYYKAYADTAPLAICRAALKAMGITEV